MSVTVRRLNHGEAGNTGKLDKVRLRVPTIQQYRKVKQYFIHQPKLVFQWSFLFRVEDKARKTLKQKSNHLTTYSRKQCISAKEARRNGLHCSLIGLFILSWYRWHNFTIIFNYCAFICTLCVVYSTYVNNLSVKWCSCWSLKHTFKFLWTKKKKLWINP